jgi:hypothetical protein
VLSIRGQSYRLRDKLDAAARGALTPQSLGAWPERHGITSFFLVWVYVSVDAAGSPNRITARVAGPLTRAGFTKMGIESVGAVVTRGVLIDVAGSTVSPIAIR